MYKYQLLPQDIKRDGAGDGDVEGVDAVAHRYADHVVGGVDERLREAVAFVAEDDCQMILRLKFRRIRGEGAVAQGHGGGLETEAVKLDYGVGAVQDGPWNLEHRAHGGADGAAVQRVAGVGGEQDGVDAERRGGAEDGADVGGIDHAVNDRDAVGGGGGGGGRGAGEFGGSSRVGGRCGRGRGSRVGVGPGRGAIGDAADFRGGAGGGAAELAAYAAEKAVAGDAAEEFGAADVYRDVADAPENLAGRGVFAAAHGGVGKALLAEYGERLHAGFEGSEDHIGALGDETAAVAAAAQLRVRNAVKPPGPRLFQRRYFYQVHRLQK